MQEYKIWFLTNYEDQLKSPSDDPRQINYKTGLNVRLHPEYTFDKGELTEVNYYSEINNKDSLVINVSIEWFRDDSKHLTKRIETRKYAIESEKLEFGDYIKVTEKYYDQITGAKADVKRRSNIVDNLTAQAETFGVLSQVQEMFRVLDDELNAYTKTGDKILIDKIASYSEDWIDLSLQPNLTLRSYIVGSLTI